MRDYLGAAVMAVIACGLLSAIASVILFGLLIAESGSNVAAIIFAQLFFGVLVALSIMGLTVWLITRLKMRDDSISTLTVVFLSSKMAEFIVATAVLLLLGLYSYWLERYEIVKLSSILFMLIATVQSLTVYRVIRGLFGYNSAEMRELTQYVKDLHTNHKVPPNLKGLKPHPALLPAKVRQEILKGARASR